MPHLVVAASGYLLVRTVPGLVAVIGFSMATTVAGVERFTASTPPIAFALVALGVVWTILTRWRFAQPPALGLGAGAAIALLGGQLPVLAAEQPEWGYALTLGVAAGCLALHRRQRVAVLLIAGVAGVTLAVPEAVWDLTDGAGGGAVVLLVAGAVLLGACAVGLRIHRAAGGDGRGSVPGGAAPQHP